LIVEIFAEESTINYQYPILGTRAFGKNKGKFFKPPPESPDKAMKAGKI